VILLSENSLNELFTSAVSAVLTNGERVAPRGLATREILGAHLRLIDPRRRLLDIPPVRVLNPAFAVAETIWILSGSNAPWICDFNSSLHQFTDDGILQGAYGPRMRSWTPAPIGGAQEPTGGIAAVAEHASPVVNGAVGVVDQLDAVRRLLNADPDSRRAVIQLFDPARDFCGHRDVPCTLGYRFYLRGGRLHMHTTMRSQDLWLGFGYDVFAATVLQELLAGWLGAEVGEYHHQVDSLHLYEPVLEQAAALPESAPVGPRVEIPFVPWDDFDTLLSATITRDGDAPREAGQPVARSRSSWDDATLVMDSYRKWKRGERNEAREEAWAGSGTMAQALQRYYQHLDARTGPTQAASGARQPAPGGSGR
jgi:thymidylate synthase